MHVYERKRKRTRERDGGAATEPTHTTMFNRFHLAPQTPSLLSRTNLLLARRADYRGAEGPGSAGRWLVASDLDGKRDGSVKSSGERKTLKEQIHQQNLSQTGNSLILDKAVLSTVHNSRATKESHEYTLSPAIPSSQRPTHLPWGDAERKPSGSEHQFSITNTKQMV